MSQPKWKELQSADEWRILIDETGVYTPEVEVAQEIDDAPEERRFELFRVPLERFKVVEIEEEPEDIRSLVDVRRRFLVPFAYETSWPHPAVSYVPWFYSDLQRIAEFADTDRESLIEQLCSEDPVHLFLAYETIAGYWGWREFDHEPLRVSEQELDERWDRDEPDPSEPFRYLCPNAGGGPIHVEKGDLILYKEFGEDGTYSLRMARVLDRVLRDHHGKRLPGKWLRVLALSDVGTFGYIRWVAIDNIAHCRKGAGNFLQWFFSDGPTKIDPETIVAMSEYGSLSESYISAALDRLEKTGDFRK